MKLESLLKPLEDYKIFGPSNIEVSSVVADSRNRISGGLFVAVAGLTVDGHQFISDTISRGVAVVVGEKKPC